MNAQIRFEQGLEKVSRAAYGSAIQDFNEAENCDFKPIDLYHYRGLAHFKLGEYLTALNDFNVLVDRATEPASTFPEGLLLTIYFLRGLAYYRIADHQAAIANFSKIIAIDSRYANGYQERAFAYLASGNTEGALQDLKMASQLFLEEGQKLAHQLTENLIETLIRE